MPYYTLRYETDCRCSKTTCEDEYGKPCGYLYFEDVVPITEGDDTLTRNKFVEYWCRGPRKGFYKCRLFGYLDCNKDSAGVSTPLRDFRCVDASWVSGKKYRTILCKILTQILTSLKLRRQ